MDIYVPIPRHLSSVKSLRAINPGDSLDARDGVYLSESVIISAFTGFA